MEKFNGGNAPHPTPQNTPKNGKMADLPLRIVSGVTLLVAVVLAIYLGGVYFYALLMAIMFAGAYEWAGLCGMTCIAKRLGYGALVSLVIVYSRYDNSTSAFAFDVAPLLATLLGAWAVMTHVRGQDTAGTTSGTTRRVNALLATFGVFYLWVAGYFLMELRDLSAVYIYALVAVLIGVDVGAYFAGRFLGGPKIWVALSPKKTWAGLLGAVLGVVVIMTLPTPFTIDGQPMQNLRLFLGLDMDVMVALAVVLSVIAQAGDFLESWMKRRAGVKDSSRLIPGHGGFLDRMDGYLSVLVFLAIFLV